MSDKTSKYVGTSVKKEEGGLWETIKVIIQALLIAVVVRTVLFQPFNIPSGSLIPTLLIGDYLFVSKYSYGYSKHSIPFSPRHLLRAHLRLRAEARRHRRVQAAEGQLDRLHQARDRPAGRQDPGDRRRAAHQRTAGPARAGGGLQDHRPLRPHRSACPSTAKRFPGGVSHFVIERDDDRGYWDNTNVYTVQPGHFFMMGDNRDNSTDSRDDASVGQVPFENLVGRAEIIFFSIDESASLWRPWEWPQKIRWNRIFERIR